ncbi:MAG: hypothetical protein COT43_01840 [Candidatus Marinimicrobia bacterium CG08_land_8_20_14_0_20_45_22]|nr:MAG: hypothetical protein COT43_01840 [Candidatus Marinimicrobia bacterium CG08_land_8_20_14_0_20_45_22]
MNTHKRKFRSYGILNKIEIISVHSQFLQRISKVRDFLRPICQYVGFIKKFQWTITPFLFTLFLNEEVNSEIETPKNKS